MSRKLDFPTAFKQEEDYLKRLHPTVAETPGCLQLFETWMACNCERVPRSVPILCLMSFQAIRSQVKAIYRYGGRPQCGQKMDDFKFCLTLKALHEEEQRLAWIKRRAEWWANRRLDRSSEDVWDIRTCVNLFSETVYILSDGLAENRSPTTLLRWI